MHEQHKITQPITVAIVDDEPAARRTLKTLLEKYAVATHVLWEAGSVEEALQNFERNAPHVLFLDIRMRDGSGFDVLKSIPAQSVKVIFTTAYHDHAIEAIRSNATDYLVKPINVGELVAALEKAHEQIVAARKLRPVTEQRILLPSSGGSYILNATEILFCKGERNYTLVKLFSGASYMVSKTLKHFEDLLPEHIFFRTHKSYLVNLSGIRKIGKSSDSQLELTDGTLVDLAREKKSLLIERLVLNTD